MKVTFEIDLSQLDPSRLAEVQHAMSVLLGIGDLPKSQTAAPRPAEPKKPAAPEKPAPVKPAEPAKPQPVATHEDLTRLLPDMVAETIMQDAAPDAEVSLDAIRSIMREKVNDYRNEIRAELKRLGAAKVTALSEEHYTAFHGFLMQLGEPPF